LSIPQLGVVSDIGDDFQRSGERTPPHDLAAEQSTLGGMLLSKDAVADVIEVLRGRDFYHPKHELIFDAVLSLYSHGEPTDVITVSEELTKTGLLQRAGGVDYLHSIVSMVPTAASAGHYAQIVSDKAVLRRLVEAGTRIANMGYASEGEARELVNIAQTEIYHVSGGGGFR
jgi:Replicative DNA helicase